MIHQPQNNMVENLIIESIQAKGLDVKYILRDMVERDSLFGEAIKSKFVDWLEIEMYAEEISNHDGSSDFMSKFGMEFSDGATFKVSVRRFREEFAETHQLERPREGDLIYLPLSDAIFEIKKVLMDENFRQLGTNYTYRLKCNLFQYSHETLPVDETMESFQDMTEIITNDDALMKTLGISSKPQIAENDIVESEAVEESFVGLGNFKERN